MKYRVLAGLLVLLGLGVWVSCGGSGSSTPSNPGVVGTGLIFVTTQGDNLISPYTIDQAAGKVSTNGNGIATGTTPAAAAMTPAGDAVFIANQGSNDIARYTVKPDGTLVAATPNTSTGGTNPIAMSMDAAGKFLFVLNEGTIGAVNGSSVSVFSIGQSAGLTLVGTTGGLNSGSAVAATPDGKFLYVTDSQYSTISGFSVDANGALTLLTPPSLLPNGPPGGMPIANATNPMGLLTTPDDAKNPSANAIFLYVAEAGTGQISVYEICDKPSLNCSNATADPGDLLEITGSPFAASGEPGSMVVVNPAVITPPSGTFLYVTDRKSNRLLQYSISVVTGNLTPLSPPAVSTGATPLWVAARHDGQYVFVVNNGSNSMSSYTMVDPKTGVLTPSVTAVTTTGNNPSTVLAK